MSRSNEDLFDDGPARAVAAEEPGAALNRLVGVVWSYRRIIEIGLGLVVLLFAIVAIVLYVRSPVERTASLEFRLIFDGAASNHYPNDTPFSTADIVATPVMEEVFRVDELQRFVGYKDFKDSMFVVQSNPAIDALSYEYQAKLADPRLSTVDRSRIEDEYRKKREALVDPQFALFFRRHELFAAMPSTLVEKVLRDTLNVWARQADERKGAVKYQIGLISRSTIADATLASSDYLVAIDMLRARAKRVGDIIDKIAKLPGATVVRTRADHVTLSDIAMEVEDLVRFEIQPLQAAIVTGGLTKDSTGLSLYGQGQLVQCRLAQEEAKGRVKALQESLRDYMTPRGGATELKSGQAQAGTTPVMPQISDSFLDRLIQVSASTQTLDVGYRQKLTDRIILESNDLVSWERELAYYEDLLKKTSGTSRAGRSAAPALEAQVKSKIGQISTNLGAILDHLTDFYNELSAQNLNPATVLFTVSGSVLVRAQRAISLGQLSLYGMLVFLLSAIAIVAGCFVHHGSRHLFAHASASSPAKRDVGV